MDIVTPSLGWKLLEGRLSVLQILLFMCLLHGVHLILLNTRWLTHFRFPQGKNLLCRPGLGVYLLGQTPGLHSVRLHPCSAHHVTDPLIAFFAPANYLFLVHEKNFARCCAVGQALPVLRKQEFGGLDLYPFCLVTLFHPGPWR